MPDVPGITTCPPVHEQNPCWRCTRTRVLNAADLCDDCTAELKDETWSAPTPKDIRLPRAWRR